MIDSTDTPAPVSSHIVASSSTPKPKAPAKKKPAPKPVTPTATRTQATACPVGDPSMGMKDPTVIRWHLSTHPERMSEIYGEWNWRAMLAAHPETPDLDV